MGTSRYLSTLDGEQVPGVTTILNKFKDSGGLIWWSNQVGLGKTDCDDQKNCMKCGRKPGKTNREAMEKAADVGTYAHALIEREVKAVEFDFGLYAHLDDDQQRQAGRCLEAFQRWWENSGVDPIETELALVSETHRFGGTSDLIARVSGRMSVTDWKTSKGLYADYVAQVAAYALLADESDLWDPIEQIDILRISKSTAAFHHHSWPRESLQPAIDYFLHARQLFDDSKALGLLLK